MVYVLGAVKPWVRDAANSVGPMFGVKTILGIGLRPDATSDHPGGWALDFMIKDHGQGQGIADYVKGNAGALAVQYIMWERHIWNVDRDSEGWRVVPDRGGRTANHEDHVHVSFKHSDTRQGKADKPPVLDPTKTGGILPEADPNKVAALIPDWAAPLVSIGDGVKWLTDSHNLIRVGTLIIGVALLMVAVTSWAAIQSGLAGAGKTLTKGQAA